MEILRIKVDETEKDENAKPECLIVTEKHRETCANAAAHVLNGNRQAVEKNEKIK